MKRTFFLFFLISLLGISACIPLWWGEYDEPEPYVQDPVWLEYLENIKAQPLEFQVPLSESAEAWIRAHDILKRYGRHEEWCSSELRALTPDLIEVGIQPAAKLMFKAVGFLFRISRECREGTAKFTITHAPLTMGTVYPNIGAHAQVIAYYILSGRFMEHVWSGQQFENRLSHGDHGRGGIPLAGKNSSAE